MNEPDSDWPRRLDLPDFAETDDEGNNHWPVGYLASKKKYWDWDFVSRMEIWKELENWRALAKIKPELKPQRPGLLSFTDLEAVKNFQQEILGAFFNGDKRALGRLVEMACQKKAPELDMHGVRAVHAAFEEFFTSGDWLDWPNKAEVIQRAGEILKAAGKPIPQKRAWTRIIKKAGLSKLPAASPGRKRKTGI
jgi:hypothetical protein